MSLRHFLVINLFLFFVVDAVVVFFLCATSTFSEIGVNFMAGAGTSTYKCQK